MFMRTVKPMIIDGDKRRVRGPVRVDCSEKWLTSAILSYGNQEPKTSIYRND